MSRKWKTSLLMIDRLENRLCPVLGAFDIPAPVQPGTGYDGVASISNATGGLLSTARHVLTAAHVPASNTSPVNFTRVGITTPTMNVVTHPLYGNADDYDIAVMELAELAPLTIDRYGIYTASDEVGKTAFIAGYGRTGTGTNGDSTDLGSQTNRELVRFTITGNPTGGFFYPRIGNQVPPAQPAVWYKTTAAAFESALESLPGIVDVQVRLVGDIDFDGKVDNLSHPYAGSFEALFITTDVADHTMPDVTVTDNFTGGGNPGVVVTTLLQGGTPRDLRLGRNLVGATGVNGSRLFADFDDGTGAGNTLNDGLGQGSLEGLGSAGDSGSPVFVNGMIAGVHERRDGGGHDGIDGNSDFGTQDSWVRVSFHQAFINGVLDNTFDLVLDMDNQVPGNDGKNDTVTLARVGNNFQISFENSVVYTEALSLIKSITVRGSGDAETFNISNLNVSVPVVIQASDGNDTIAVTGTTPSFLTIDGQGDDDHISIAAVSIGDVVTVNGDQGSDLVDIGAGDLDLQILGSVGINGPALKANIVDSNAVGDDDYILTATSFDKPTMPGSVSIAAATSVTVNTSIGKNLVEVRQTGLNIDYFVNTVGDDDAVVVGQGNIAVEIRGDLTINAGSGADTITFDDSDTIVGGRTHTLTSSSYAQTGLNAVISFSLANQIVFEQNDDFATINITPTLAGIDFDIRANGGNDSINLTAMPLTSVDVIVNGGLDVDALSIVGGAGADTITVNSGGVVFPAGTLTFSGVETINVDGKAGNDTININGIGVGRTVNVADNSGTNMVNIGNGDLDLNILGTLNVTGSTFKARILDNLAFGDDDYVFSAVSFDKPTLAGQVVFTDVAAVTLETSVGFNTVELKRTFAATEYFINTGVGNDEIIVGKGNIINDISGDIFIDGGMGVDTVTLNDLNSLAIGKVHTLASSNYTQGGLVPTINYAAIEFVALQQGTLASFIDIKSTDALVVIEAHGNGGGDTFTVDGAPAGTIRLFGVATADAARLIASAGSDTITLSGKTFQYSGAGVVEMPSVSMVDLDAAGGGDLLAYVGTAGTADKVTVTGKTTKAAGTLSANGFSIDFHNVENLDATGQSTDGDQFSFYCTSSTDQFDVKLGAAGTVLDPVAVFRAGDGTELLRLADYRNFSKHFDGEADSDLLVIDCQGKSVTNVGGKIFDGSVLVASHIDFETVQLLNNAPVLEVAGLTINDAAAQRSMVTSIDVRFNGTVNFVGTPSAAFQLTGPGGLVELAATPQTTNGITSVRLTFTGAANIGGSLSDGQYSLKVLSAQITGGLVGGDYTSTAGTIFRLFGDANGDGTVAANDFIQFRLALGGNSPIFDFDGDGAVAASDFIQFRLRFGGSI